MSLAGGIIIGRVPLSALTSFSSERLFLSEGMMARHTPGRKPLTSFTILVSNQRV